MRELVLPITRPGEFPGEAPQLAGNILLLLGGPSSGKTGEITKRVIELDQTVAEDGAILCLAPDSVGTGEIISRLTPAGGRLPPLEQVRLTTPPELANTLLRSGGANALELPSDYTVWGWRRMNRELSAKVISWEEDPGATHGVVSDICSRYWAMKAGIAGDYADRAATWGFGSRYEAAKAMAGGLDLYDLVSLAIRVLREDSDVARFWTARIATDVLVDDFDKLTPNELRFIELSAQSAASVTMAASINVPRCRNLPGGPDLVDQFRKNHRRVSINRLRLTHRHTRTLATLASRLTQEPQCKGLNYIPYDAEGQEGDAPVIIETDGSPEGIAASIEQLLGELPGYEASWKDVGVMCRDSSLIGRLRTELETRGIPAVDDGDRGGTGSIADTHVIGLLAWVVNPNDDDAFCAAAFGRWDPQGDIAVAQTVQEVFAQARRREIDPASSAEAMADAFAPDDSIHRGLLAAAGAHRELNKMLEGGSATLSDLVEHALGIMEQGGGDCAGERVRQLVRFADGFSRDGEPAARRRLAGGLDDIHEDFNPPSQPTRDGVTLSTIPPAGKRYWPTAFVIDTEDTGDTPDQEDRLLYEAITRATDRLIYMCPTGHGAGGPGGFRFRTLLDQLGAILRQ